MPSKRYSEHLNLAGKKVRWKTTELFRPNRLLFFTQLFTFLLAFPFSSQSWDGVVITQEDYQGLQAFKHAINDPKGFLHSWNGTGLGACSGAWEGIKCVRGKVVAIQLPWRGFGGHITEKIGQFTALRKLSLHDNDIAGQIPSAIGFLRDIRGVYLFNNRLSGSIPPSLGNCLSLQTLDLSKNSLVGSIPSTLSNSSMLYRVNLSFNGLTGSIPDDLASLPSLMFLHLQRNNLSGSLPDTWEAYQLETLRLEHNSISGNIPKSLCRLPMLQVAIFSNNKLNGSLPEEMGMLSRIRTLDVSFNSIRGRFPVSLCNLTSLIELNLDNNLIGNRIPATIDGLKNLFLLSLKSNRFHGEIPETIGNISGISLLDLSENNLAGKIPASLDRLVNLTFFNVSYNNLSGQVPIFLSKKFNSSSFLGNIQLCGYSSSVTCTAPPSPNHPPPPGLRPKQQRRETNTLDIILIAVGAALVLLVLLCILLISCLIRKRSTSREKSSTARAAQRGEKPRPGTAGEGETGGDIGGKLVHFDGPLTFSADDLLCATAEIMGKSTYGTMYMAKLEDGSQIAVKRLRERISKSQREFEEEANVLGKIRHPHLLPLRAYYVGPKGEKLLVFDYMPKGSLSAFFHARGPETTTIDWATRMRIAMGAARGLQYLHAEANIVHGNLTSANVLLDETLNSKIANFGLSRLVTAAANSNVIAAESTLGYGAPELSKLKRASTKTDVYSLGVIFLELLTGKSPAEPTNGMDLPLWVASIGKEEWINEVFEVELMKIAAAGDQLVNTLKLALRCVDPSPAARPEVHQVLRQLEEIMPELVAVGRSGEESFGGDGRASTSGDH
ncbi:hypothetical protein HPP92_006779 [Vanilla planifolia]|uniref:Protein kinase domain-containing protein n=1 Tax=Vanilla planifolia TaxID=51239 RepID=A0A835RKJ6_VANPL|nr:hypothetical protein HPP92_006779 [Vanilla planifolia]